MASFENKSGQRKIAKNAQKWPKMAIKWPFLGYFGVNFVKKFGSGQKPTFVLHLNIFLKKIILYINRRKKWASGQTLFLRKI